MLNFWNKKVASDMQFFMDSIGDGILVVDNNGVIINANNAICEMLDYCDKKTIAGQLTLALLKAIDEKGNPINSHNAALFKSINQGKKINNAVRQFIKKDGSRFWASITTTPIIKENGATLGAIIVIRDITEEKKQEEYHTDFAHIASHNLRTPLGNASWATEYILTEKSGKLNNEQKDYLSDVYQTLKNMNRLVNDLLNVSRLQNKKIKPLTKKVSFKQIIKKVIDDSKFYAKAQNVKIKTITGPKQLYIKIDENHLRSIIQNVIENAIRYSFPKTIITIQVEQKNSHLLFSCTDTGIGIPPDQQSFIFAKFFRAKNAVNKIGDGTGLGMYITRELVELNRGKIWFDSIPGKKTTFFIKFKSTKI